MIRIIALLALLAGPAYADDGTGLGSHVTSEINQQGLATPSSTDLVKMFRGQNGDAVFAPVSSLTASSVNAGSNLTFYVATTGSDSNPCSLASKCLTIQHAVNVAAAYNYQGLYAPTINVATGTYTSNQVTLLPLTNCPLGGTINFASGVTVNDGGTGWTFSTESYSFWTFGGSTLTLGGSYGGLNINSFSTLVVGGLTFSGSLSQGGINVGVSGILDAISQSWNTTTSAMGTFIYTRGNVVIDSSNITFTNPVTFTTYLFGLDFSTGRVAGIGLTFTNHTNVTTTAQALVMTNGAFFEADATTKVDGSVLTRANFPGSNGVIIDTVSTFMPDSNAGTNPVLVDKSSVRWLDAGITTAGTLTFTPPTTNNANSVEISGSAPTATFFGLVNSSTGGHTWLFTTVGQNTDFNIAAGGGAVLDATTGNLPFWWVPDQSQFGFWSAIGWGASAGGSYGVPTIDTSLSRDSAGVVDVGTGAAGNSAGTIKAAHATLTTLANAATTSAICYNTGTGVLTYDGTIGTCTTSDERLKNIGKPIDHALDRLLKITGFYFTYKDPQYGKGEQIGVGAQTVEKVFPELVETGSDGIKSVAYEKLVAPIIEALRELKADNDNMRKEINLLRRRR